MKEDFAKTLREMSLFKRGWSGMQSTCKVNFAKLKHAKPSPIYILLCELGTEARWRGGIVDSPARPSPPELCMAKGNRNNLIPRPCFASVGSNAWFAGPNINKR
jgi:hypothetical protein